MIVDDTHDDLHKAIEDDVRSILVATFEDPLCRANVLLNLLHVEFMALDNADDVAELAEDMLDILGNRAVSDLTLFNVAGNA